MSDTPNARAHFEGRFAREVATERRPLEARTRSSEIANLPRWRGQPGFFEIWFLVVFEPGTERAYWLRYTTFAPAPDAGPSPTGAPRATVWAAAFDARAECPVVAGKTILPAAAYDGGEPDRFQVRLGSAAIGEGCCHGEVCAGGHAIAWDLRFTSADQPAQRTPEILHRLPLPTRGEHANMEITFDGWVTVDGERRELRGAPGMQAHIHGTRRVEELFWIYGAQLAADRSDAGASRATPETTGAAVELVSTRLRRSIGGLNLPGIASLWLRTSTEEIDLTQLPEALASRVESPGPGLLHARAASPTRHVALRAWAEPQAFAGYVYRDPGGRDLHVAQSDVASMVIEVFARPHPLAAWRPVERLVSRRAAALELHGPEPVPGVAYIPWDGVSAPPIERRAPAMSRAAAPLPEPGAVLPLPEPAEIFALGLTYRDHVRETASRGEGSVVFRKARASWMPIGDEVRLPSSDALVTALEAIEPGLGVEIQRRYGFLPALLDYEVELGMILLDGVRRSDLDRPDLAPRIGYFLAGDITARSCQILGEGRPDPMPYWGVSKSFPGFLPTGPAMWVPAQLNVDAAPRVTLRTSVNGGVRQEASTAALIYTPRQMLRHVARVAGRDLAPGDVVLTGTPAGVAFQVPVWKRRLGDLFLDRFGKLEASLRSYLASGAFLWPGDHLELDGGPLGARSVTILA